ncbi:integral membrane protein [Boeremia exigua]|uniref:uncharacterized protein n=1 Tax=Boeremia exigua TaxID=749465 RepID=UPI001E8E0AA2|nr:uncharacterized protein C7974DRAFT_447484 [Boeremia exigua]KAH6642766.1 integral membrane protein [Boeremia exigua]
MAESLSVQLHGDDVLVNDDLYISFHRTVRVPDNQHISNLPPDFGKFPLTPVSQYASKMRSDMAAKGGIFFPMYQSEAMWMNFSCSYSQNYMIKIYVGGVNVISGEPAMEGMATTLRRRTKMATVNRDSGVGRDTSLQDYIIVPGQRWLDGIAESPGRVKQFVAMPFGSGYSLESQVTGIDTAGGIQFEITPYTPPNTDRNTDDKHFQIIMDTPYPGKFSITVKYDEVIKQVKNLLYKRTKFPPHEQILTFSGKRLDDYKTLSDYNVCNQQTIYLTLRLRGGGKVNKKQHREMSIATGGATKQCIEPDYLGTEWQSNLTTVFNVQILNSIYYEAVTGKHPPTRPLSAARYARYGLPFFKLYEEPSAVHGNFASVKSIAQIDQSEDAHVTPRTVDINKAPVGIINPHGPLRPFRTAADLKNELQSVNSATF